MLALVILGSLIGGALSLVAGIAMLYNKKIQKYSIFAAAFAAGALLAASFLDLLPEALHAEHIHEPLIATLSAIIFFLILENTLHSHTKKDKARNVVPMIVIGDTLHNFIDGIAIAAGFLVSPATGIVVTLGVALHEIPQEIGDFGIMLNQKISRHKIILINVASALASTLAATFFYFIGNTNQIDLSILLGIVAGFFIYISLTNLVPSINNQENSKTRRLQLVWLLVGLISVGATVSALHNYIDPNHKQQENHRGIDALDHGH